MSFFSELGYLVRQLFTKISSVDKIETVGLKHFPFSGYAYMMWCGKLIYRSDRAMLANPSTVDLNHEMIHLYQAKDCGSWFRYYLNYAIEWLRNNPFTSPSGSAYYTNKYEVEAYAKENDLTYLLRRTPYMVDKYKLLYPKKFYRNCKYPSVFKKEIEEMFQDY